MLLITLIRIFLCVGLPLWLVNTNYIPVNVKLKQILNLMGGMLVTLWLLFAFGILGYPARFHMP